MQTNQIHSGLGDNVNGNKYVTNVSKLLDPDDWTAVVHDLMFMIAIGECEEVRNTIEDYQKILNLSSEIVNLFKILSSFVYAFESHKPMPTDLLKIELKNGSSAFNELYQAILVRALAKADTEKARKVYLSFSKVAKHYLPAAYHQLFATTEELQKSFEDDLYVLDDYSLFYLAQGLWRVGDYPTANQVLRNITTDKLNETLEYWLIATELNSIIFSSDIDLAYIDRNTSHRIENLAKKFIELIPSNSNLSPLAISILISFVNMTMSTIYMPAIRKIGLQFRQEIKRFDEKLGDTLNRIFEQKPFEMPDWLLVKLVSNQAFEEDEIDVLLTALLHYAIDIKLLARWLEQSEIIVDSEIYDRDFLKIFLQSFNQFESMDEKYAYLVSLNTFLDHQTSNLRMMSPTAIKYWCDNLSSLGTSFRIPIYKILSELCSDLSVNSELNLYYLSCLLHLDKLETMGKELAKIKDNEWNDDLHLFQARYFLKINEYQQAQTTYEKIIDKEEKLSIWYEYLASCIGDGKSLTLAKQQLLRIPISLLSINTEGFEQFILQIAFFIDFDFAEQILVKLFVEQPNKYALLCFNLYTNAFTKKIDLEVTNKKFANIYEGVVYEIDNKQYTKILVDSQLAVNKELININGNLGQLISRLAEGNETPYNFDTVTLLKRQSISATVYQLSMQIVSDEQHNYDEFAFHQFNIREDSLEDDLLRQITLTKPKQSFQERTEDLSSYASLPLYIKGAFFGKQRQSNEEPYVAYIQLLDIKANQCLINSEGNTKEFDAIVIDVYGAVYLCLTNLYKAIITAKLSVYISKETASAISNWINYVTDDSFLLIDEDQGQLYKTDATTIKHTFGSLIEALGVFLDNAIVASVKVSDLPTIASEMHEWVSPSVFSTMRLALANDIPWLCLDSAICAILCKKPEHRIVDARHFMKNYMTNDYLTVEDRKQAMEYAAFFGLYTQYYYSDLTYLAKDIRNLTLISSLLDDHHLSFPDSQTAIAVLAQMIKNIIFTGSQKRQIKDSFRGKGRLELAVKNSMYNLECSLIQRVVMDNALYAILNKSIECIEGDTIEDRLAKIITTSQIHLISGQHSQYFYIILENFIRGKFLNFDEINRLIKL